MRSLRLVVFALLLSTPALPQKIDDGLWNAGRAFGLQCLNSAVQVQRPLMLVDVYPGFAAVKSTYELVNTGPDSVMASFLWLDTATTSHRSFKRISNLPSAAMKVMAGKDSILLHTDPRGLHFRHLLPPGATRITTYQLAQTNQAKLVADEAVKEANAFVLSSGVGNTKVFVRLQTTLTQSNLIGVYPQTVEGTMQQLRWQADSSGQPMVIWYEGAAPDYKFEKKVLPKQDLLYQEIDGFDLALFDIPDFEPVNKTDFTTTLKSTLGSVLYFILFSVPWLILLGFIIFLLKKPRKKANA